MSFVMLITLMYFLVSVTHLTSSSQRHDCESYHVDEEVSSRLLSHSFINETVAYRLQCFVKCIENCLCESFNVCGERCELNSAKKQNTTSNFANRSLECSYYELKRSTENKFGSCEFLVDGCCKRQNPCLNHGECRPTCNMFGKRYHCNCKARTAGDRCEIVNATTCQDYLMNPKPSSGVYKIVDRNGNLSDVFCDFDSESEIAWTLVRSFDVSNYALLRSFNANFDGFNDQLPGSNWSLYQMSKEDMVYLRDSSTHWRATCEYNRVQVDYVDYIRSSFNETDLLNFRTSNESNSDHCRRFEYANIRGRNCTNCTVAFQQASESFHSRHTFNSKYGCEFNSSDFGEGCGYQNEKFFGSYKNGMCVTGKFRCTQTNHSTTQFWFGG